MPVRVRGEEVLQRIDQWIVRMLVITFMVVSLFITVVMRMIVLVMPVLTTLVVFHKEPPLELGGDYEVQW
jgi:hypothetical protein